MVFLHTCPVPSAAQSPSLPHAVPTSPPPSVGAHEPSTQASPALQLWHSPPLAPQLVADGALMQIEFAAVPLQQPAQVSAQPPLPPPTPLAQVKFEQARVPHCEHTAPPVPQLACRALSGLLTQLPSLAQQPLLQVSGPQLVVIEWPQDGAPASVRPTVNPRRSGARR